MPDLKDAAEPGKTANEIESLCRSLFNEWLLDLDYRKKEIWLWNSLVEMAKIKQRKGLV